MNKELVQLKETHFHALMEKDNYNLRRSAVGTKCRKIWAWGRALFESEGASQDSTSESTLDTKDKTKASRQCWFARHTLPARGYFILFISFDEASFAR